MANTASGMPSRRPARVSYAASAADVDAYIAVAGKFLDQLTA